jgi:hypothetical protein
MTTPREQLIEAMADALATPRASAEELAGRAGSLHFYRAVTALNALSDLGAVVLMPVQRQGLSDRAMYYSLNDYGVLNASWVGLELPYEDLGETAYINALEGEQS